MHNKLTNEDFFELDRRNVLDEYKGMSNEDIKRSIQEKSLPFAVCMSQLAGDFNFGNVVRTANGLGAREIFYYGNKRFDRRAAVGSYHYLNTTFLRSFVELAALKNKYSFIAMETLPGAKTLEEFAWPTDKQPLILIGEESQGLTKEVLDLCEQFVIIPQRGSVRSLNAASAASIAMWDFVSKYKG
jgi:tRNA G18 (ribose-2'-O)-methylase SpoU